MSDYKLHDIVESRELHKKKGDFKPTTLHPMARRWMEQTIMFVLESFTDDQVIDAWYLAAKSLNALEMRVRRLAEVAEYIAKKRSTTLRWSWSVWHNHAELADPAYDKPTASFLEPHEVVNWLFTTGRVAFNDDVFTDDNRVHKAEPTPVPDLTDVESLAWL